ncbi:MAG: hypothetical protein JRJ87_03725 [Deltaproteobacteria bacterium]|nr:hypothetical protein [Deltaproteobacteria bacterium]
MIRFVSCCWLVAVLFSLGACGIETDPAKRAPASLVQALQVQYDSTGIHYIEWEGTDILAGVGGYYIIGSCTGADDENQNVISLGSDGQTLHSPGVCPGAPFSIQFSGTNPIQVNISVGPLPVDYRALSVPFDPTMAYFDNFLISTSSYLVGCANTWTAVSGSGGPFSSIPQPCVIPGHGAVGLARISNPGPGWWGEISGSVVTVRRTILSGDVQEAIFVNHPYTHNMELTFHTEPMTQQFLPAGSIYTLQEEISFREPGSSSGIDDATLAAVDIPASATVGDTISVSVTMLNTGDTTWLEPADHLGGTRLGSLNENALTWVPGAAGGYSNSQTDQRLYLPAPVSAGQEVTFSFQIQVPSNPGNFEFAARMVHDGVAWFGSEIRQAILVDTGTNDAGTNDAGTDDAGTNDAGTDAGGADSGEDDGGQAQDSTGSDQDQTDSSSGCSCSTPASGSYASLVLLLFLQLYRRRKT